MDFCKTDPSRDHRQHSRRYHLWRPASQYSGNGLAKDLPIVGIYRVDLDHLRRSVYTSIDSLWLEHRVDVTPGGLAARLDLLKQNLLLSTLGAATGVCFPIGLSYLLLYLGYGYGMSSIEVLLLVDT